MIRDRWNNFLQSRATAVALTVVAALLVALLVFQAGAAWGERRAFDRAHPPISGADDPGFGFLPHGSFPEGHGAVGTVASITPPYIALDTRDGERETVRISSSTDIRAADASEQGSLRVGESVIVIGDPDETSEMMDARLIRILPPENQ